MRIVDRKYNQVPFIALLFYHLISPSFSQEPSETEFTVQQCKNNLITKRQKIRSGVVTGDGFERFGDTRTPKAIVEGKGTIDMRFDFARGFFLSNHLGPYLTTPSNKGKDSEPKSFERRTIFCSLPDKSFHFSPDAPNHLHFSIDSPQKRRTLEPRNLFFVDVRAVGLIGASHFFDGDSLEDAVENYFKFHPNQHTSREENGLVRLWAVNVEARRRNSIWIDTLADFVPIKSTEEWGAEHSTESDFIPIEVLADHAIEWELQHGVYVPISYHHKANLPYLPGGLPSSSSAPLVFERLTYEIEYKFHWSRVNDRFIETEFDYHNYKLPEGTNVFDERSGKSVFVERIGVLKLPIPSHPWRSALSAIVILMAAAAVTWFSIKRIRMRFQS